LNIEKCAPFSSTKFEKSDRRLAVSDWLKEADIILLIDGTRYVLRPFLLFREF
jgi:hypothetical protein